MKKVGTHEPGARTYVGAHTPHTETLAHSTTPPQNIMGYAARRHTKCSNVRCESMLYTMYGTRTTSRAISILCHIALWP